MDLDDINPIAVLLGLIAFMIAVYVSKSMGASLVLRLIYAVVVGIVGYFVATFIANK